MSKTNELADLRDRVLLARSFNAVREEDAKPTSIKWSPGAHNALLAFMGHMRGNDAKAFRTMLHSLANAVRPSTLDSHVDIVFDDRMVALRVIRYLDDLAMAPDGKLYRAVKQVTHIDLTNGTTFAVADLDEVGNDVEAEK